MLWAEIDKHHQKLWDKIIWVLDEGVFWEDVEDNKEEDSFYKHKGCLGRFRDEINKHHYRVEEDSAAWMLYY